MCIWTLVSQIGRKEGTVLFTVIPGIRHTANNHSYQWRHSPSPFHGLLYLIISKGSFICIVIVFTCRKRTAVKSALYYVWFSNISNILCWFFVHKIYIYIYIKKEITVLYCLVKSVFACWDLHFGLFVTLPMFNKFCRSRHGIQCWWWWLIDFRQLVVFSNTCHLKGISCSILFHNSHYMSLQFCVVKKKKSLLVTKTVHVSWMTQ